MRQVKPGASLLVWDTKGEWSRKLAGFATVRSIPELHARVTADLAGSAPLLRVAWVGTMDAAHFESFCRLAWVWLRARPHRWLIVEELADVTNPGKAPAAWGEILRKSRDQRSTVIGLTQRPAESDKTIAGNAAVVHCGFQAFPRDRKTIAEYLDVPLADVAALGQLDWIERNMRTRQLSRGRVNF